MAKPPTYERKALEKIWSVLQEIEERRLFSPENRELRMFFIPPGFNGTRLALDHVIAERSAIMEKLLSLGAITIIQTVSGLDGGWVFKTGPKYERVFSDYEKQYGHAAGLYEEAKEAEQEKKRIEQAGIGSIHYDPTGRALRLGAYEVHFEQGDTNQSELCRVLLKDGESAGKSWDASEMLEEWGWPENRVYDGDGKLKEENRLKVYHAAKSVNEKTFKATAGRVSDLLTFTTKYLAVTEKYRRLVS